MANQKNHTIKMTEKNATTEVKVVKINDIKSNPNNPRIIKDDKFKKLVESIKSFPEMANVRPIVVNTDMIVLGGNMRLKAMKEAGWKEAPIQIVDWNEQKQKEFIVKDNVGFGEWDWDDLANNWDEQELSDWGLDLPIFDTTEAETIDEKYTNKIEIPIYEPSDKKPNISELYNLDKYNELISKIKSSSTISEQEKEFLQFAATRHIVFNYQIVADYYAHSNNEIQDLIEKSALVIIDFNKSIENGFVKMSEEINKFIDVE
jgi:hypothetical protein